MSVCGGGEKGPDDPWIPALTRVEPAAGAARDAKRRGDWEGRASRLGLASARASPPSPCTLPLEAGRSQSSIQGFRVSGKERRLPSSRGCPDLLLKLHAQGRAYFVSPDLDFLICKMGMMKYLSLCDGSGGLHGGTVCPALACREQRTPAMVTPSKKDHLEPRIGI